MEYGEKGYGTLCYRTFHAVKLHYDEYHQDFYPHGGLGDAYEAAYI